MYRSMPPVLEVARPEHLLPSAYRPSPLPSDGDTDESGARLSSEFDENFSSTDSEEVAGTGDGNRSPSVERDSGMSHPKALRTTTRKRRAASLARETRYV